MLTEKDLDNVLYKLGQEDVDEEDKNKKSPLRKVIDEAVIPAGTMAVGGTMAAMSAINNLKTTERFIHA